MQDEKHFCSSTLKKLLRSKKFNAYFLVQKLISKRCSSRWVSNVSASFHPLPPLELVTNDHKSLTDTTSSPKIPVPGTINPWSSMKLHAKCLHMTPCPNFNFKAPILQSYTTVTRSELSHCWPGIGLQSSYKYILSKLKFFYFYILISLVSWLMT